MNPINKINSHEFRILHNAHIYIYRQPHNVKMKRVALMKQKNQLPSASYAGGENSIIVRS